MKGAHVSITTDAWTSCNDVTYITCTAHFVHPVTWVLHHMPLKIFKKFGTSQAEDVVRYVNNILAGFNISYSDLTCIVTDTEATMVKAARIFCNDAGQEGTELSWHGCIDHLLNLVTKVAFKDSAESDGAVTKARELVGHLVLLKQKKYFRASKYQVQQLNVFRMLPCTGGVPIQCVSY